MQNQRLQQLIFLHREADGIFTRQLKFISVQSKIAEFQLPGSIFRFPSCHGSYPSKKLLHGKWLRQVVIRTGIQSGYTVVYLRPGGQQQYRRDTIGRTDLPQNLNPAFLWHHDIQNNQVVSVLKGMCRGLFAVINRIYFISLMLQGNSDDPVQVTGILCK